MSDLTKNNIKDSFIHQKLQWDFTMKNKVMYITFILMCLISFPIQFNVLPTQITKLIERLSTSKFPLKKNDSIFKNIISNLKVRNIAGVIVFIIILWLVITICSMILETVKLKIFPKHLEHLRHVMFKNLIERHKDEYNDVPSAEAIQRVLEFSRVYAYNSEYIMSKFIPYSIGIIVVIGYAIILNPMFGIITGVCLSSIVINCLVWGRVIADTSNKREGLYLNMVEDMNDNFNNLMNVYINNKENEAVEKNDKLNKESTEAFEKEMAYSRNSNIVTTALSVISLIILLVVGFNKVKEKKMTGFKLATFITIYIMYMHWSMELFQELPYFFRKVGIWEQSQDFVKNLFVRTNTNRQDIPINSGSIKIENINFKYPKSESNTFTNYSLEINHGEKVAIVGRSGSGKSTLMKLVLQMYPIESGRILIDGKDSKNISLKNIRDSINYINQRTILGNDTIINNMSFGNDKNPEEIKQFLKKHNLESIFSDIENGIYAESGYNGGNLSAGMQKTVLLVRSLLKPKSKVYVFDEPLAGLDKNTRNKITNMIEKECKGSTVICITHNKQINDFVDRTIVLTKNLPTTSPTTSPIAKK